MGGADSGQIAGNQRIWNREMIQRAQPGCCQVLLYQHILNSQPNSDAVGAHCTTCCIHGVLPVRARLSTCRGHGNSLMRIDSEQVESLALDLGGDGDGGLVRGGQHDPVERDGGEVPQQGREAVREKAVRCGLGAGLALGSAGDLAVSTGVSRWARAAAGFSSGNSRGATRRRTRRSRQ